MHVELLGVTKAYGPVRALTGVSARFDAGIISIVEGANGSGKSTLLALLAGLAKPTLGRVRHDGMGSRAEVRKTLGWVGHETLCYGDLSGRENVELAAKLHDQDPREAWARARTRFDLGTFGERPVRTYSRGQRQRIALARALVHDPMLVLLDEPTAGLDVGSVARLSEAVREEAGRGAIVVVVTHDVAFGKLGSSHLRLERGRLAKTADAPAA